ncbi:DUF5700 domain-containing putative Zn-dependent protease [candidate division KSB1 bacterium]
MKKNIRLKYIKFVVSIITVLILYIFHNQYSISIQANTLISGSKTPAEAQQNQNKKANFKQAELMLEFLQSIAEGKDLTEKAARLLKEEGTELIIEQFNLARKATMDQYRQILFGLIDGKLPDIKPVDAGERAKRGVIGLTQNAWPIMQWGIKNTNILREKLNLLKELDIYSEAKGMALKYLPEKVDLSPRLFFVMGGRVGAAALQDQRVYLDVLAMSFSTVRKNKPFLSNSKVIEFFAHEMHHLGYSIIREKKRESLSLNKKESYIFDFLTGFVSEGSATYLLDGSKDLNSLKGRSGFKVVYANPGKYLGACERIVKSIRNGDIKTDEDFDKATSQFLGNMYHSAGSVMFDAINQVGGIETIMKVISDPRLLLIEYNKAAEELNRKVGEYYLFERKLVRDISAMGN